MLVWFVPFLTANAQISVAPKIGLSYTKLSGDFTNARFMPSAVVGGMIDVRFSEAVSLQTGVLLSGKGSRLYYDETDEDAYVISYFEVPLNFVIATGTGMGKFQFFGGPYVAYAANATYKYLADEDDLKEKISIGTSPQDEIKPGDIGVNAGIGYWFEGLEVQAGYGTSLTNISNKNNEKLKNNIIFFTIAYYINLGPRSRYYSLHKR